MRFHLLEGEIHVEDPEKFIKEVKNAEKKFDATIQFINSDMVAGRKHVEIALEKAMKNFGKKPISSDPGMEILLYVSAQRQIKKALKFGIKKGLNRVVVVILGNDNAVEWVREFLREKKVLKFTPEKRRVIQELYGITNEEIEITGENRIEDLVVERVVLFSVSQE